VITAILSGILIGGLFGALLGYFGKCSSGTCPLTATPLRGAIYGAAVGVLLTLVIWRPLAKQSKDAAIVAAAEEKGLLLNIISESDYNSRILKVDGVCLVNFFSERCPHCLALAPTIALLGEKYAGRVTVAKVNVDKVPSVAQRYGVRGVPVVLIISNGKEVKRLVGSRPETAYSYHLNKLVKENN